MSSYFRYGADVSFETKRFTTSPILRAILPRNETVLPVPDAAISDAALQALLLKQQQAEAEAAAAGAYDEPAESHVGRYVVIGVGALALLGLLAVVLKKPSKVSGYRRRRRR